MSGISIPAGVESVACNPDGSLDDVAISVDGGMFRIEQMSKHVWWLCVYLSDGRRFVVNLHSKKRVRAEHRWEDLS